MQVMQHYAKSHPVRMKLMVTAAPVLRLQNNSFTIEIPCFVVVSALLSNSMIKPIFAVNAVSNYRILQYVKVIG